jgi:hypothetical protein
MGAVDTTYTFTATDTITSTKMNNIIDQTTITTDAIIGTTLDVASGKLKVRAQGITSNEMAANSVTSANIVDGTIVNADISPTAAIAGTKISTNFGTQNIVTTGTISTSTNYLSRQQTPDEGGEIQFARALDNATAFTVDCYGSGSSPNLRIFGTTGQVATITAAGNVGIGTSSPSAPLEINGGGSIDANPDMRVSGSSGYIDIHNSLSGGGYNGIVSSGDKAFIFSDGTSGTGNLVIAPWAANASGIRINSSGNVGICKSSPTTALDVNGTVTATAFSGPLTGNVTGNVTGTATTATTVSNGAITAEKLDGSQSGPAPIYGIRAWVSFDMTRDTSGTVTTANTNRFIYGSGNVSSVKKTATGEFLITFTAAMPNTNYAYSGSGRNNIGSYAAVVVGQSSGTTIKTTTQIALECVRSGDSAELDFQEVNVMVIA